MNHHFRSYSESTNHHHHHLHSNIVGQINGHQQTNQLHPNHHHHNHNHNNSNNHHHHHQLSVSNTISSSSNNNSVTTNGNSSSAIRVNDGSSTSIITYSDSQISLDRLFNPPTNEASVPLRQRNLPSSFFNPTPNSTIIRQADDRKPQHPMPNLHLRSTSFDQRPRQASGIHMRTQSMLAPMTELSLNPPAGSTNVNTTDSINQQHDSGLSNSSNGCSAHSSMHQLNGSTSNIMSATSNNGPPPQVHQQIVPQPQQAQQPHHHHHHHHNHNQQQLHYRNYSSPAFMQPNQALSSSHFQDQSHHCPNVPHQQNPVGHIEPNYTRPIGPPAEFGIERTGTVGYTQYPTQQVHGHNNLPHQSPKHQPVTAQAMTQQPQPQPQQPQQQPVQFHISHSVSYAPSYTTSDTNPPNSNGFNNGPFANNPNYSRTIIMSSNNNEQTLNHTNGSYNQIPLSPINDQPGILDEWSEMLT